MIILDTDFLVNSIKNKVDVTAAIKDKFPDENIVVFDKVFDELDSVNNPYAKAAKLLIKIKGFNVLKSKKELSLDEIIIEKSKEGDFVATQDRKLKSILKKKGVHIITIRQKKYVKVD